MIGRGRRRRLVVVLEPAAVHVIDFREASAAIELTGRSRLEDLPDSVEEMAAAVASLIESRGGRGGRVVLALRGYGVRHHLLQLPPAEPAIWAQIVQRETQRLGPAAESPVISFVACGSTDRGGNVQRDLLVGAAPRALVEALTAALRQRQIQLEHLTILPQAIRRALREIEGEDAGAAVLLAMLDGGPLLAFFHEGELRLVIEPPLGGASGDARVNVIHDAIERGLMHMRQQFRGSRPDRLLIAAPAGEEEAISDQLRRRMEGPGALDVKGLGAPESLVALGAILDAEGSEGLDLRAEAGPRKKRTAAGRPSRARRHRPVLVGGVVAAALWSLAGSGLAWARAREVRALESEVASRDARLMEVLPVLQARRAHDERTELLTALAADDRRLDAMLHGIGAEIPGDVRLESLELRRGLDEWELTVQGTAFSGSSAAALGSIQTLSDRVAGATGAGQAELVDFDYLDVAPAAEGRPGVWFHLFFRVPVLPEALP